MPPSTTSVLQYLEGTGKRIVTIDISKTDKPEMAELKRVFKARKKMVGKVESNASVDEVAASVETSVNAHGQSNASREPVVTRRLENLGQEYADTDVKIGVLAGGVHTAPQHDLARSYRTERVRAGVGTYGQATAEKQHYEPYEVLIQQLLAASFSFLQLAIEHR